MKALGLAVALAALAGCPSPPPPTPGAAGPVEAVQAFADALRTGETQAAWSLLSARTRAEADRLAAAAQAVSDAGPSSGKQMLFGSALPQGLVEARQLSLAGDSAEVQTGTKPLVQVFHVVREGGVWRVDLPLTAGDGGPGH